MSDVHTMDSNPAHLFPEFRLHLDRLLADLKVHTGEDWRIVEGYRSQARQDWLYAQGRTRPGPVVTWMHHSMWHSAGLAADLAPSREGYSAPRHLWETLHALMPGHALSNPAWAKGDLGHVQLTLTEAEREKALAWVARGFR